MSGYTKFDAEIYSEELFSVTESEHDEVMRLMADEGYQVPAEQSNAGKWILIVVAVLVVAGFGYAHYATHAAVTKLTQPMK